MPARCMTPAGPPSRALMAAGGWQPLQDAWRPALTTTLHTGGPTLHYVQLQRSGPSPRLPAQLWARRPDATEERQAWAVRSSGLEGIGQAHKESIPATNTAGLVATAF